MKTYLQVSERDPRLARVLAEQQAVRLLNRKIKHLRFDGSLAAFKDAYETMSVIVYACLKERSYFYPPIYTYMSLIPTGPDKRDLYIRYELLRPTLCEVLLFEQGTNRIVEEDRKAFPATEKEHYLELSLPFPGLDNEKAQDVQPRAEVLRRLVPALVGTLRNGGTKHKRGSTRFVFGFYKKHRDSLHTLSDLLC